jgi:hypothetical protein
MDWARILAYITGASNQELLLRNKHLVAENRILKAQLQRCSGAQGFRTPSEEVGEIGLDWATKPSPR